MAQPVQYTYRQNVGAINDQPKGTIYGLFGIDPGYTYKMTSVNLVERDGSAGLKLTPKQYIITIKINGADFQTIYLGPDYVINQEKYVYEAPTVEVEPNVERSNAIINDVIVQGEDEEDEEDEDENSVYLGRSREFDELNGDDEGKSDSEEEEESQDKVSGSDVKAEGKGEYKGVGKSYKHYNQDKVSGSDVKADVKGEEEEEGEEEKDILGGRRGNLSFRHRPSSGGYHSRRTYRNI